MRIKLGIIIVSVLGAILFLSTASNNSVSEFVNSFQARPGVPAILVIPTIGVQADVEYVELAPDGSMDVPKFIGNVGWYGLGPRPGEIGSAVIDGHYGILKDGASSIFDNLHKLKVGDKIESLDSDGKSFSFIVRQIRSYDPKADAKDVFTSTDGKAHLNLITCEGVWNKSTQSYSQRLVIFADKE